ncbi:hypothetical protein PUN28_018196 [Cardiocondyla obscurior]|uniref:Uncharacterized protein n=1 Tax=Cardiocondyla obscurior TaxID=286306 RepID=A0AAW2EHA2_9HYME
MCAYERHHGLLSMFFTLPLRMGNLQKRKRKKKKKKRNSALIFMARNKSWSQTLKLEKYNITQFILLYMLKQMALIDSSARASATPSA